MATTSPSSAQAAAQEQPLKRPLGVPYFDQDTGQICEERTATVEETEVGWLGDSDDRGQFWYPSMKASYLVLKWISTL